MRQKNLLREAVVFLKEKTKTLKEKISISFFPVFRAFPPVSLFLEYYLHRYDEKMGMDSRHGCLILISDSCFYEEVKGIKEVITPYGCSRSEEPINKETYLRCQNTLFYVSN